MKDLKQSKTIPIITYNLITIVYSNFQVNVSTGKSEVNKIIKEKSVQLAVALDKAGVKRGDIVMVIAPNSLKISYILFATFMSGFPVLPLDPALRQLEIESFVNTTKPKIIFYKKDNAQTIEAIEKKYGNVMKVVLDDPTNDIDAFVNKYKVTKKECDVFVPPKLDLLSSVWLLATSGTTGLPKIVIFNHENLWFNQKTCGFYFDKFPSPTKSLFIASSPQWMGALTCYCSSTILAVTRLVSSAPMTSEVFLNTFKVYKPTFMLCSPTRLLELKNTNCDISSLEIALIGGSGLIQSLEKWIKEAFPTVSYLPAYGMTELFGVVFHNVPDAPSMTLGREFNDLFQYRLVDVATGNVITEPNVPGELQVKTKSDFVGYYKNPAETANTKTKDGFVRTGDLIYKDKDGYYYFIERLKLILKYKTYHVYPLDIESLLCSHKAVANAGVIGVPSLECGELPLALVQLKDGHRATATELCDFVASKLSDSNRLRGGIIFVNNLPLTPSFKLDRGKLKGLVDNSKIEF